MGHGDEPTLKASLPMAGPEQEGQRFAVVVTVASRPVRRSADGTGVLEATSVSSAAWLAGSGLLSVHLAGPDGPRDCARTGWTSRPRSAWELADDLDGAGWSSLTLPVDGVPTPFRYRESEYGWVLAGSAPDVHLGAYGRGMSAVRPRASRVVEGPQADVRRAASRASGPGAGPRRRRPAGRPVRTCCAG